MYEATRTGEGIVGGEIGLTGVAGWVGCVGLRLLWMGWVGLREGSATSARREKKRGGGGSGGSCERALVQGVECLLEREGVKEGKKAGGFIMGL